MTSKWKYQTPQWRMEKNKVDESTVYFPVEKYSLVITWVLGWPLYCIKALIIEFN